jgi:hypothetical protein
LNTWLLQVAALQARAKAVAVVQVAIELQLGLLSQQQQITQSLLVQVALHKLRRTHKAITGKIVYLIL